MSTDPQVTPRPLLDRPNLRHLKDQAKDLFKTGAARSVGDVQFKVASLYGFASWPKLKAHGFAIVWSMRRWRTCADQRMPAGHPVWKPVQRDSAAIAVEAHGSPCLWRNRKDGEIEVVVQFELLILAA